MRPSSSSVTSVAGESGHACPNTPLLRSSVFTFSRREARRVASSATDPDGRRLVDAKEKETSRLSDVAFARGGEAVVVAPRWLARLDGKWLDTTIELPGGTWVDELSGERYQGGTVRLDALLGGFPGALLLPAL